MKKLCERCRNDFRALTPHNRQPWRRQSEFDGERHKFGKTPTSNDIASVRKTLWSADESDEGKALDNIAPHMIQLVALKHIRWHLLLRRTILAKRSRADIIAVTSEKGAVNKTKRWPRLQGNAQRPCPTKQQNPGLFGQSNRSNR